MSILVYSINPGPALPGLAQMFRSNNLYKFNKVDVNCAQNGNSNNQFLTCLIDDWDKYQSILSEAKRYSAQAHVLILQSGIKSVADAKKVEVLLSRLSADTQTDLYYLFKYGDRCDHYQNFQSVDHRGIASGFSTADIREPSHGIQALLISPTGRDKILNASTNTGYAKFSQQLASLIQNGTLNTKVVTPNVFNIDLSSTTDYSLANECQVTKNNNNNSTPNGNQTGNSISGWWFVLVVALVLILAFLAIWFGSRKLGQQTSS